MTRDPKRITRILAELERYWRSPKHMDESFFQALVNMGWLRPCDQCRLREDETLL